MTTPDLPQSLRTFADKGRIDAADVLAMRQLVYRDDTIGRDEADGLIALDNATAETAPEWVDFLAEALTDHLVRQARPEGYVSDESAAWLVEALSSDGIVSTGTGFEALLRLLHAAVSAPPTLAVFALQQVAAAVLDGEGPLARDRSHARGVISADEVAVLRRILYAGAGPDGLAISRPEADVLFDLNDRSSEADNDPAWSDLFVKAIANHLMAAKGYQAPSRAEAARREDWLNAPAPGPRDVLGVGGVLGGMAASLPALQNSLRSAFSSLRRGEETVQAEHNRAVEVETAESERITADEVVWLSGRIGRAGALHRNEQALLRFLRDESPVIDPALKTLLDRVA